MTEKLEYAGSTVPQGTEKPRWTGVCLIGAIGCGVLAILRAYRHYGLLLENDVVLVPGAASRDDSVVGRGDPSLSEAAWANGL